MKSTIPLFLAFLYLSNVVAAQAQTQITGCGTLITRQGQYELANDLLNCSDYGVRIDAEGVVIIQLNSHQITGVGMSGIGIDIRLGSDPFNLVGISGSGTISGFATGVRTTGTAELEIVGVTCNGNFTGFAIGGGAHANVMENMASGNSHGFQINNSSGRFNLNKAEHNAYEGFVISGGGNSFRENTALDNGRYGIYCSGGQNAIVGNITRGNSADDLFEANSDCVNQWTSNAFITANKSCIH
jgi:Periplasmic copper-binding protein (NosD)